MPSPTGEISSLKHTVSKLQEQLHLQNRRRKRYGASFGSYDQQYPACHFKSRSVWIYHCCQSGFSKAFDTTAANIINKMNVKHFPPFQGTELSLKISQMIDNKTGFDIEAPFPLNKDKDTFFKCRGTVVSTTK